MKGYDLIPENEDILLDLSFYEGVGLITHDQAKPHHSMILNDPGTGSFVWISIASGLMVLDFVPVGSGPTQGVYLNASAANTADLDFTNGNFSIGGWINWEWNGQSSIIIGRYGVNFDGWEIYLDESGGRNTVSQRHSHASLTPNLNSNCFSTGWTPGTWAFLGISRTGGDLFPIHYRNGIALTMAYEDSGMLDPDSCNRDLVVGCRYTKDANWYKNQMWGLRIWERTLSAVEWLNIFERERDWFGI